MGDSGCRERSRLKHAVAIYRASRRSSLPWNMASGTASLQPHLLLFSYSTSRAAHSWVLSARLWSCVEMPGGPVTAWPSWLVPSAPRCCHNVRCILPSLVRHASRQNRQNQPFIRP